MVPLPGPFILPPSRWPTGLTDDPGIGWAA